MRIKASHSKAKPAPAVETSDSINAQIAAFLKSGGEIQQIAKGVSGQTFTPSKQINLGKKVTPPPCSSISMRLDLQGARLTILRWIFLLSRCYSLV